jgi:hypothetical protein
LDQDKAFVLGDVRPGGEDVSQAKYLGRLVDHEHGVSGEVYERNPRTLVIKVSILTTYGNCSKNLDRFEIRKHIFVFP